MQYRTFNQTLLKRLIDTKLAELIACGIINGEIIRIHPLDFLFALSKCGIVKKKEDFYYLYEKYMVEIDSSALFMNDVITVTL